MKRIHTHALTTALLFLAATATSVAGTVRGHVLGADGRPLPAADVHIYPYGLSIGMAYPINTVSAERDGSFSIDLPEGQAFTLVATGVDHNYAAVTVPGGAGESETIGLEITLPRLSYASTVDSVMIIGSWNEFSFETAKPMKRQPDGTFTYDVKMAASEKEASYQIMGVVGMRSVNAPGGNHYEYDGAGDYRTVIALKKGRAHIVFNPALLQRAGSTESRFTFDNAHDWMNRVAAIDQAKERINTIMQERQMTLMPLVMKAQEAGRAPDTNELRAADAPFKARYKEAKGTLTSALSDPNPTVRIFAATALAMQQELDTATALAVLKALPADDPRWQLSPQGLTAVGFRIPSSEWANYQAAVARNPWRGAGLRTAVGKMMMAAYGDNAGGGMAAAEKMYEQIAADYAEELQEPENADVAEMIGNFDPKRAIRVGKQVPDFNVKLMDGGTVSRASMMGKTYMIDFWAVWCGPCRGELPGLHTAYEKFKTRGFNVLSLSFDEKPADVTKFRKGPKTPMPWMHSFVNGGFNSELAKAFEVEGIPKPILVGPDGTILATEGELRGPQLDMTLERFLPADHAER